METRNLKDVIHLYLGCECICQGEQGQHKFTGISYDDTQRIWWVYFEGTEFGHAVLEDVAPILRPLSDMTDNEIDELASVLLGKETHCFHKWRSEDGDCIIADWKKEKPFDKEFDTLTMGMLISGDFSIKHKWDYSNKKGTATTNEPLWNSHLITKYLLSKHFDLFGLIDAGLAIDKTNQ